MIRSKLYIKIYLTVLGSLALVAVVLTALAFLGRFDIDGPFASRLDRFAAVMLTEGMDRPARKAMLERLARAAQANIAIFDRDGRLIDGAGPVLESATALSRENFRRNFHTFEATLPDGSMVVAEIEGGYGPKRRNFILTLLAIVTVTGLAAYPAVRHLTRRLDTLRLGAERWGNGDLTARVTIAGHDEIATVARTFNRAADRIEALVNSQKSLLANASHELRSPLARLRMAIEMYEISQSESLKAEIVKNLVELDELVDEILIKSRLGSDQPFDLGQAIDLLGLAGEEAAAVDAQVDGEAIYVRGSDKLLRRMIRNLLLNAVRHGKPPVTLTLSSHGDRALLCVTDHGDGLKAHEANRIFEPFYRPEGRSEAGGGWGLGLSLVAEIAKLHGGSAYYRQPPEGGACFCVELDARTKADAPAA